jgi:hypothetical protein
MMKMVINDSVRIDGFRIRIVNASDLMEIESLTSKGNWHIGEANLQASIVLVIEVTSK